MTVDSGIDPEIAAYLLRANETYSNAHHLSAVELRATMDALRPAPVQVAAMNEVRDLVIPAHHGEIKARLYRPTEEDNLPLLVWYHGGGWVLGNLDSADMTCRDLASHSGCNVLSVDYRLAPEHPFPAAYDDAITALHYVFDEASSLGANINRIAIGGDSAGANLATCTCIEAKDLDIKFQLLIYPVVEADFSNASYTENAENFGLTRNLMQWFWDQYVPKHADRSDPRVNPLNGDLGGLPPTYLLSVKFDPLRDEGLKYGEALKQAGVRVESAHACDTIHGFFTMPTKGSAQAKVEAAKKLQLALM